MNKPKRDNERQIESEKKGREERKGGRNEEQRKAERGLCRVCIDLNYLEIILTEINPTQATLT